MDRQSNYPSFQSDRFINPIPAVMDLLFGPEKRRQFNQKEIHQSKKVQYQDTNVERKKSQFRSPPPPSIFTQLKEKFFEISRSSSSGAENGFLNFFKFGPKKSFPDSRLSKFTQKSGQTPALFRPSVREPASAINKDLSGFEPHHRILKKSNQITSFDQQQPPILIYQGKTPPLHVFEKSVR